MDKTQIRQMEWRLHQYYRRLRAVERFERIKQKGIERIKRIEGDIHNCNFKIENPLKSPTYDGMPKASMHGSAIEESLIRAYDKLEREMIRLMDRDVQLTVTIARIHEELELMTVVLDSLEDEQRYLLNLRYGQEMTLRQIAGLMNLDFTSIHYRKAGIMELLSNELIELAVE